MTRLQWDREAVMDHDMLKFWKGKGVQKGLIVVIYYILYAVIFQTLFLIFHIKRKEIYGVYDTLKCWNVRNVRIFRQKQHMETKLPVLMRLRIGSKLFLQMA